MDDFLPIKNPWNKTVLVKRYVCWWIRQVRIWHLAGKLELWYNSLDDRTSEVSIKGKVDSASESLTNLSTASKLDKKLNGRDFRMLCHQRLLGSRTVDSRKILNQVSCRYSIKNDPRFRKPRSKRTSLKKASSDEIDRSSLDVETGKGTFGECCD